MSEMEENVEEIRAETRHQNSSAMLKEKEIHDAKRELAEKITED